MLQQEPELVGGRNDRKVAAEFLTPVVAVAPGAAVAQDEVARGVRGRVGVAQIVRI